MTKEKLRCLSELEVVNLKNHNSLAFRCELEYGHKGSHQAKGTSNYYPNLNETECHDGDYTITWIPGLSAKEDA